ncbi:hypothetical protein MBLNU459_g5060t1 [Dothideomycetes sp. NU459]
MASIKAIQQSSVHQIQSGQVIVDLNSVVKELVENSIDASATSIEVRFRNHGLDAIEVVDNGTGIAPEDYESVALKHHTSKLGTYDDLTTLNTFGFRGEALASLCALSRLHIVTARDVDQPKGNRLDFEISGKLKSAQVVPTQRGTKVVVEKIFHNLPVRKKELEKNIKREYGKVLTLLQAYACISTGVRFVVSNTMPKGSKSVAFSTAINTTTKDNITNVFGAKTLHALAKLELDLEMQPSNPGLATQTARSPKTQPDASSRRVTVQGHISRPVFGEGRQAPDRQMFFVNSRPCALPQVAKAFNEVYKMFNVSQSPFIFANLVMDTSSYDVNVSPDKRTILLHDQVLLLETLKAALTDLFDSQEQSVPQSKLSSTRLPSYKPLTVIRRSDSDVTIENVEPATPLQPRRTAESSGIESPIDHADAPSTTQLPGNSIRPDRDDESTPQQFASQRGAPERLVHAWVGRNAQDRDDIPTSRSKPQKPPPAPVQSAFDRMRPPRTPHQMAEITIGDVTTSTVIGNISPAFKKRRIHTPQTPQAKGLRAFALSGTQNESEDESAAGSDNDESAGDRDDGDDDDVGDQVSNYGTVGVQEEEQDDDIEEADGVDSLNGVTPQHERSEEHVVQRRAYSQIQQPFTEETSDDESDAETTSSISQNDSSIVAYPSNQNLVDADSDDEYLDDDDKKTREDERVALLIRKAEVAAARPSADNVKRASKAMIGSAGSKHSTLKLVRSLDVSVAQLGSEARVLSQNSTMHKPSRPKRDMDDNTMVADKIDKVDAEAQLSLTVSKSDFAKMSIVGQFNLGFVLALRSDPKTDNDDLFIIDQHAADEKFNFERFTRSLTLDPQRLAQPKQLYLTAIEEEIILAHPDALTANGFEIETDTSGTAPVGQRCRLVSLPMSKEKTFDLSDLEELLHLLSEHAGATSSTSSTSSSGGSGSVGVPRPSKVRKMLAMRACRSSIMVGKTLTAPQMAKVVRNLGGMDKPWNCPHGRPTMRHLAGLGGWITRNGPPEWESADGEMKGGGEATDRAGWLRQSKGQTQQAGG